MNFIKKYDSYNIINEAIAYSVIKPYIERWKKNGGENKYKEMFGGKYRLYLDLVDTKTDTYKAVEKILTDNGYSIVDYHKNIASKDGDNKNTFKIGKILQRFAPELKPEFDVDKDKVVSKDYSVVISRHPYDVVGMSTDRRWNSCMEVEYGENAHYLMRDIRVGTLVAYVIRKDDTNINDPINRLLIKPFIHEDDDTLDEETILATDAKVYFNKHKDKEISGFRDTVEEWLEKHQNVDDDKTYHLHGSLYADGKSVAIDNRILKKIRREYESYTVRDGYIEVKSSDGFGLLSLKGKVIIPAVYHDIEHRLRDFYNVAKMSSRGIINGVYDAGKQKLVVPMGLYMIFSFYNPSYSPVNIFKLQYKNGGGTCLYDSVSQKQSLVYSYLERINNIDGNIMFLTKKDGIFGVINENFDTIMDNIYDYIEVSNVNYKEFICAKNNKHGVVDIQGKIVIPFEYDGITTDKDTFILKKGGETYIADKAYKIEKGA
jgi:hypothetical protein